MVIKIRLLTLGDSGTGKSSVLSRYTEDQFNSDLHMTIGIDFRLKTIDIAGEIVKVQVYDTAGQERYRTITYNYYRGCQGIILVYDITSRSSFLDIERWMVDVEKYTENIKVILLGNKSDLTDERKVTTTEGQTLADKYGISFLETSAKSGEGITRAFNLLIAQIDPIGKCDTSTEKIVTKQDLKTRVVCC